MLMAETVKSISEKNLEEKEKRFLESYNLFYDIVSPQIEKRLQKKHKEEHTPQVFVLILVLST